MYNPSNWLGNIVEWNTVEVNRIVVSVSLAVRSWGTVGFNYFVVPLVAGWPWQAVEFPTAAYSSPVGWERTGKVKAGKLLGWDKDSLVGEAKLRMPTKRNKEWIHYFPLAGRCSSVGKTELIMHNDGLGRQKPMFGMSLPSSFSPSALIAEHDAIWYGVPLWPVWVSSPGCVLFHSSCSPSSWLGGQREKLKCPWLSVSTALQQLKYQCAVNTVLVTSPKHRAIEVAMNKINSSTVKNQCSSKSKGSISMLK